MNTGGMYLTGHTKADAIVCSLIVQKCSAGQDMILLIFFGWRSECSVCWHIQSLALSPVFPDSLLCSFPQVPLFVPVSFTIICLFTVAMSFYSDPVSISIGCTMVLSGFPVYYLIIRRQMSDRCRNLFCKYALDFQHCGPKQTQGLGCWFVPRACL